MIFVMLSHGNYIILLRQIHPVNWGKQKDVQATPRKANSERMTLC